MNPRQASASSGSKADEEIRKMRSYNHLYEKFISEDNIRLAIRRAAQGKRKRRSVRKRLEDP